MNIYIIIVNYCGAPDTLAAIDSILKAKKYADANANYQVLIIDNNSPKKGIQDIQNSLCVSTLDKSMFQGLECSSCIINDCLLVFIQNDNNAGFGAGNNIGINYVKCNSQNLANDDFLILLNNDTEIEQCFFRKILENNNSKEKMAFSVKSLNYYTKEIDSTGFGYINYATGRSSHFQSGNFSYLVGSCIILNHIPLVPLFDEKFFLYYEDADYSAQLRSCGFTLSYDSTITFYHKVSASSKQNPLIERIKKESMIRFMRKNASFIQNLLFVLVRIGAYLLKCRFIEIKLLFTEYAKPL